MGDENSSAASISATPCHQSLKIIDKKKNPNFASQDSFKGSFSRSLERQKVIHSPMHFCIYVSSVFLLLQIPYYFVVTIRFFLFLDFFQRLAESCQ